MLVVAEVAAHVMVAASAASGAAFRTVHNVLRSMATVVRTARADAGAVCGVVGRADLIDTGSTRNVDNLRLGAYTIELGISATEMAVTRASEGAAANVVVHGDRPFILHAG